MKRIKQLMIKEFLQIRRDRRMLPLILIAPILQVILLGYAATIDVKNISLVVCNLDPGMMSRDFVQRFTTTGYFSIVGSVDNPHDIDRYLDRSEASLGIVIPSNFSRNLEVGRTAQLQFIADGADANTANISLGYASQITLGFAQTILIEELMRKSGGVSLPRVKAETRVWFNPDLRSANYMVPGVVALVLFIITAAFSSASIVKEREIGTLEQLLVTPIKRYEFIIGKLLPYVLIGFLDVLLVMGVGKNWFNVPLNGSPFLLLGLCALFLMTTLGLGLFVSTVSHTQQQALMTMQFFIMFPFMFLSGFTFPIENMPPVIQALTYLIPLRYFMEIVRGVFLKGVGIETLWPQALALLVFGIVILSLSVARFQKKLG